MNRLEILYKAGAVNSLWVGKEDLLRFKYIK